MKSPIKASIMILWVVAEKIFEQLVFFQKLEILYKLKILLWILEYKDLRISQLET